MSVSLKSHIKFRNQIQPLSGISNVPTILCNEDGYYVNYQSDKYGFRNTNSDWNKKIDILIVGDSYGQGVCIENEYDLISIIKNKLNLNIINLSYGGNGPLIEYATLREYLPILEVKNIFWFYFEGDDLENLSYEF